MTKTETKMIRNIISDSCITEDEKVERICSFINEYTASIVEAEKDAIRQDLESEGYDLLADKI